MKCPYCGIEMEKGIIQDPHEISWNPGEERPDIGLAALHKGSVVLSKFSLTKGSAVLAYLCRDCQKVVIDYSDKHSDLNAK